MKSLRMQCHSLPYCLANSAVKNVFVGRVVARVLTGMFDIERVQQRINYETQLFLRRSAGVRRTSDPLS